MAKFSVVRFVGENEEWWYSVVPRNCNLIAEGAGPNWEVEVVGSYDTLTEATEAADLFNQRIMIDKIANMKLEPDTKDQLIKPENNDLGLPLASEEAMEAFDKELNENEEHQKKFKEYLTGLWKIGGDVTVNRRKFLEKVFHDELAIQCSWTGTKDFIPVFNLKTIKCIIDVLLELSNGEYTRKGTISTDSVYNLNKN